MIVEIETSFGNATVNDDWTVDGDPAAAALVSNALASGPFSPDWCRDPATEIVSMLSEMFPDWIEAGDKSSKAWNEENHPRYPAGTDVGSDGSGGGRFAPKAGSSATSDSDKPASSGSASSSIGSGGGKKPTPVDHTVSEAGQLSINDGERDWVIANLHSEQWQRTAGDVAGVSILESNKDGGTALVEWSDGKTTKINYGKNARSGRVSGGSGGSGGAGGRSG